jgi:hypothetical protein
MVAVTVETELVIALQCEKVFFSIGLVAAIAYCGDWYNLACSSQRLNIYRVCLHVELLSLDLIC